jgi:hypothetical protein
MLSVTRAASHVEMHYVPASVSVHWPKRIEPIIKRANLWESGGELSAHTCQSVHFL